MADNKEKFDSEYVDYDRKPSEADVARRQSVALNLVENPLKVGSPSSFCIAHPSAEPSVLAQFSRPCCRGSSGIREGEWHGRGRPPLRSRRSCRP